MPQLALCIERLNCPENLDQFTQCVVLSGDRPGLGLDLSSQLCWQRSDELTCEFWLSADSRVMLMRPPCARALTLVRAGRSFPIPAEKPVVLLNQDIVVTPSGALRLHFHGPTENIHPPQPFRALSKTAALAATVALSASLLSCEKKTDPPTQIDVLDHPPKVAAEPRPATSNSAAPSNEKLGSKPPSQ
jgi:hypothetical protein